MQEETPDYSKAPVLAAKKKRPFLVVLIILSVGGALYLLAPFLSQLTNDLFHSREKRAARLDAAMRTDILLGLRHALRSSLPRREHRLKSALVQIYGLRYITPAPEWLLSGYRVELAYHGRLETACAIRTDSYFAHLVIRCTEKRKWPRLLDISWQSNKKVHHVSVSRYYLEDGRPVYDNLDRHSPLVRRIDRRLDRVKPPYSCITLAPVRALTREQEVPVEPDFEPLLVLDLFNNGLWIGSSWLVRPADVSRMFLLQVRDGADRMTVTYRPGQAIRGAPVRVVVSPFIRWKSKD
jgi:hypothetical protein